MIRKTLFAAALVAFATPAMAFHCPADMAQIDELLVTVELSDGDRARVVELRAQGEELHNAGQHQESVDTLAEALEILGQ